MRFFMHLQVSILSLFYIFEFDFQNEPANRTMRTSCAGDYALGKMAYKGKTDNYSYYKISVQI